MTYPTEHTLVVNIQKNVPGTWYEEVFWFATQRATLQTCTNEQTATLGRCTVRSAAVAYCRFSMLYIWRCVLVPLPHVLFGTTVQNYHEFREIKFYYIIAFRSGPKDDTAVYRAKYYLYTAWGELPNRFSPRPTKQKPKTRKSQAPNERTSMAFGKILCRFYLSIVL